MSAGYAAGGEPPLNQPWYGIGFGDAVKRWSKKLFVFNGRASRGEFWWVMLLWLIVSVLLGGGVGAVIGGTGQAEAVAGGYSTNSPLLFINWIVSIAIVVLTLGLFVRRLHDANFSGWLVILWFIPCLNIVALILAILPSKPEGARFDQA